MKIRFLPIFLLVLGFTQLSGEFRREEQVIVEVVNNSDYDLKKVSLVKTKKVLKVKHGVLRPHGVTIDEIEKGTSKFVFGTSDTKMRRFDVSKLRIVFKGRGRIGNSTKNVRIGRLKFDYFYRKKTGRGSYSSNNVKKILITIFNNKAWVSIITTFE